MDSADTYDDWKFWPVILIAFLYPVNNGLIGLAIPLFYFQEGFSLEIIGILAAGAAMTYMFSPILFNKLSNRIGRKRSLILGITGCGLSQLLFYFTLEPIPFLISRLMEGLLMGFYWSNLMSSMSDNSLHDHRKMISRYNISWNAGLLTGLLIGAIFLFFIDEVVLIFYFAPFIIFIDILIIVFFFQESKKVSLEEGDTFRSTNFMELKDDSLELTKFKIPKVLPIVFVIVFGLSKATVNFLYPVKSEMLGFETYSVYFLTFLCICAQLMITSMVSYFKIRNLKRFPLVAILLLAMILVLYGIFLEFWLFIFLFIFLGLLSGLLYGTGLRILISLNMREKTSKYASIYESVIGSAFFITPLISGFIAVTNLTMAFFIISLVNVMIFMLCLVFIRNFKMAE